MPTLADVSVDSIRRWLTEEVDLGLLFGDGFVRLPPDLPDAFGRFWAPAKVGAINTHLMRWLIGAIRACPDAAERAPLLALLKAAVPRAGWYIGQSLLGYISDLGGDLERDFFIAVEGDLEIHERTREEAARLRKIIESSAR